MQAEPHLQDYLQVIIRRRWIIITVFIVLVVSVLIWTLKQTLVYESTTTLLIEPQSPRILSVQEVKPMGADNRLAYQAYYETQYKLIKGHILLKKVADILGLKSNNPHAGSNPVERLLKAVKVTPVRNSQLVEISVQDPDPQMTADIANTLADEYIKQNLERNTGAANSAADWLSNKIEEQKQKLKDSDLELQKYRMRHNINILPQTSGEGANENVRAEYSRLQALFANYSERYTDEHPKMIELKAQINSLRNKIQGLEDIDKGNITIEYRALEKDVQNNKDMHEILVSRLKEIDLSSTLNVNNISVVNRAEVSEYPVKPNLPKNMFMAIIMGLFMGTGLGFFVDYLDRTIKSPDDIKNILEAHFIGAIPELKEQDEIKKDKIVHVEPKSPVSEAYRDIRTEVLNLISKDNGSTILVTSAEPKAGKTITAANLSIALSQKGGRVLLVDCDLRKSQVHRIFNLNKKPGLTDYLLGEAGLDSIIKDTEIEDLKVVTSGKSSNNPAEILSLSKMEEFIQDTKQQFDHIIFDSPPVASVTDAVILASLLDATIQVVRSEKALVPVLLRVKEKLENTKTKFLGIILNDLKTYHDKYSYYKYSRYYGEEKKRRNTNT